LGDNEEIILEKFVHYINKVYGVSKCVHEIRDGRSRRSIKTAVVAYLLVFAFVLQVSSFREMVYLLQINKTRFLNLLPKGTRLPKIDAIRDIVKGMFLPTVQAMHNKIINKTVENKV